MKKINRILSVFLALTLVLGCLPGTVLAVKPAAAYNITVSMPQNEPMETASMTEEEFRETYTAKLPDSIASAQNPTQTDVTGLLGDQLEGLQQEMYEFCSQLSPEGPGMTIAITREDGYVESDAEAWWQAFLTLYAAPFFAYKYDYPENTSWTTHVVYAGYTYDSEKIELSAAYGVSPYFDERYPAQIASKIDAVLALAPTDSRYNTLKFIHNWVIAANEFDWSASNVYQDPERYYLAHGPVGCMLKGAGLWESYAMAFKMFCNRLGIPCTIVTGYTRTWNYVMMEDGKWYLVDCAADDSDEAVMKYDYFLVHRNTRITDYEENGSFIYPTTSGSDYPRPASDRDRGYRVMFDVQGGALPAADGSHVISGYNRNRGTGELIVYNISGQSVNTDADGIEVAVDSTGQVTAKREFGQTATLTVPEDGFVLSEQGDGSGFVGDIQVGDYAGYDADTNTAYHFTSYDAYLSKYKYIKLGEFCGQLPTPTKEGYTFEGWYTQPEGEGTKYAFDTWVTDHADLTLYAYWAAVYVKESGTCGDNLTWELTSDGVLTISGTGAMYDYRNSPRAPWLGSVYDIKSLVIQPGATTIGVKAFYYCSSLTNVTIPNTVTTIGESAFIGCSILNSVVIPNSVTSIGGQAFEFCSSLTDVTIPDSVTSIGESAFSGCSSLTSVKIPDGVTAINNYVFRFCSSMTSVTIPGSVSKIGNRAFEGCSSLASVEIPNGETVIEEYAFSYCDKLKSVSFPNGAKKIDEWAFVDCGLTSLTIPANVQSIGAHAFSYCSSLTSVSIPSSVTEIGMSAFGNCSSLTSLTINNPDCNIIYQDDTCGYYRTTVIHGYAGSTAQAYAEQYSYQFVPFTGFNDVKEGSWYYNPVLWASGNGITGGVGGGKFAPNDACTRAQVVTFLWNAAGKPEPKSTTNPFSDVKETDYFYKAVLWAVENGITSGVGDGKFGTKQVCTRGQVVAFMWNAAGKPEPKTTTNPFSDVKETDYYYKAVLWAVENGVTSGTGNGQFSPKAQCTRAQVVTFLYSYYG